MARLEVLDKGYVRLVEVMGSDLSVVNAARASFLREHLELDNSDRRLIDFLWRNQHTSPFRHAFATFEVKAPLFIARQWWKYVVGSSHLDDALAWNEVSRRYITLEPEFYFPAEWRSAPASRKQGSGPDVEKVLSEQATESLIQVCESALAAYQKLLNAGIAPEQARMILPSALYTVWRWSASLHAILHFLEQRISDDAQDEIQQYAKAVQSLLSPRFPLCLGVLASGS